MKFLKDFENPSVKYRIKPFWFWNGEISKKEIRHQIEEMAEKGLGGMFICARQGLTLPYLSAEWFEMTEYACNLAEKYGLEAWLYDEYPYPSGMSGGEVLLEHPEAGHMILHHKSFTAEGGAEAEANLGWTRVLYAKAIPLGDDRRPDWSRAIDLKECVGNLQREKIYQQTGLTKYNKKRFFTYGPEKILKFCLPEGRYRIEVYTEGAMEDFKYYGGFFDPCNKEAVGTFIKTTHERYRKAVGGRFGVSVHGMFSDEVGLLSPVPWSNLLPEAFVRRNGYDLLECLPAVHDAGVEKARKIRYDLYETAHELFRESYHKQVSDWCRENHLLYATEVPSMRMSTQMYSDITGGDTAHEKLGRPLEWIYDEYLPNYRSNAKAVSSLARQLDKPYAMIESFHSVGWTMTMQDAKWMIDRLGASGINLYNFHAFYYTIQDITKHDAPPSQFLQNPYWKYYRKLADYVARMGVLVTNTEADIRVAVLDPAAALFTRLGNPFHGFCYAGESMEEKEECDGLKGDWVHICKTLLFAQIDYDHLDAEILKNALVHGGKLCIGRAAYSVVVLPPCSSMERCAREKLEEFIDDGGHVIGMGKLPYEVIDSDMDPQAAWNALFHKEGALLLPCEGGVKSSGTGRALTEFCKKYGSSYASVEILSGGEKDMVSCVRFDEEGALYVFLANQGNGRLKAAVTVKKQEYHSLMCLSLEDGSIQEAFMEEGRFTVELGGFESRWYMVGRDEAGSDKVRAPFVLKVPFTGEKKVSAKGGNICRFAFADMIFEGKEYKRVEAKTFIEQCAQLKLLGNHNLTYTGTFGTPKKLRPAYPFTCRYRVEFMAEIAPEDLRILMDRETVTGKHRIFVNGIEIGEADWEPVFVDDQNNRAAKIGGMACVGKNEIVIEASIEKDEDGLKDCFYLWGTFGVERANGCLKLTTLPAAAELTGTWVKGFPFYSGTFTFEDTFSAGRVRELPEEMELELDTARPVYDCLEVLINGCSLGVKAYTPYRWKLKKQQLKEGENHIAVRLTNTLANMLDGAYFDYDDHRLIEIGG